MTKSNLINAIKIITPTAIIILLVSCLIILMMVYENKEDNDYSKLGIDIQDYQIEYGTYYGYNSESKFKIYKIKDTYSEDIRNQIENSSKWSKEKLYDFVMQDIHAYYSDKLEQINKENLYYYSTNGIYAMYETEAAILYYFSENLCKQYEDYSKIFGVNILKYTSREIYNVKDSMSGEGIEYYVYDFSEEKGNEIENELSKSSQWNKEKLDSKIFKNFTHNLEVNDIENGYYHYKLVCRTIDKEKRENPTEDTDTGFEIGVYDVDKNRLYYYWYSK